MPNISKNRINYLNKIREIIKECKLSSQDTSDKAILEFSQKSAFIPTPKHLQNVSNCIYTIIDYEKERVYSLLKTFMEEELKLDNLESKKSIKVLNENLDKLNIYLAKNGFRCIKQFKNLNKFENIRRIPVANNKSLLQNKRIKLLKSLAKEINSKIATELNNQYRLLLTNNLISKQEFSRLKVDEQEAILRITYLGFKDLYESNNEPKDLKNILQLVDYYVTEIFPAASASFSQNFIHNLNCHISTAHYLPEIATEKNHILPLEFAIPTGIGVCHQKAFLCKFLLDKLKTDYPDLTYSKTEINKGMFSDDDQEQYFHYNNSIINKDKTISFEFDSFLHKVSLINLDFFNESYNQLKNDFFQIPISEYDDSFHTYQYNSFKDFPEKKVILDDDNLYL